MAGNIDKGHISKILGPNDWYGHPTRAQIDPCSANAGAVTPAITIPWYLRGKMGNLSVGDCVAFALFDDTSGVILSRLDGEWTGHIDYDTTTTGDVVNEKTEFTIGHFTGTGGMAVSGGASGGASIQCTGDMELDGNINATADIVAGSVSLQGHTHNCPHGGSTSAPSGGGSGSGGGGGDSGDSFVLYYDGEYEVTPATTAQTLETAQRFLEENVEIKEIPYAETSNNAGGETAYIGREIE